MEDGMGGFRCREGARPAWTIPLRMNGRQVSYSCEIHILPC